MRTDNANMSVVARAKGLKEVRTPGGMTNKCRRDDVRRDDVGPAAVDAGPLRVTQPRALLADG